MRAVKIIMLCLLLGFTSPQAGWPVQAQTLPDGLLEPVAYLPVLMHSKAITCNPSLQEQQIADLMINDPLQERPSLTCNPILEQVAGERAQDMIDRDYFSHINPDGFGPNYLVELAGYVLPDWYGDDPQANYIESIAAGNSTASATWTQWMNSPGHKTHILGLDPFYAEQIEYGIGYAYGPGSDYGHYWVVITAKPGP